MNIKINAQYTALIKDTILKELRSKTLIFIFIATTLLILLGHSLLKMYMQSNPDSGVALISGSNSLSLMFSIINFWSLVIAGIFGISSVRSDFQEKIIYQYLTFPISRFQYMTCRILGSWFLVFTYYLYSYLLSALLFSLASKTIVLHWNHLLSIALMAIYTFLVIIISFIYSLFAEKIPSFLLLFATIAIISFSTNTMRVLEFGEYLKDLNFFKMIGLIVYLIFPRINYVSELASAVMFNEKIQLNLTLESLHLLLTSSFLIFFTNIVIKKKDF